MLHITNGESVIGGFRAAGLAGAYLSWIDVLHEGPVPGLPLQELSDVRARAIADLGWGGYEGTRRTFAARDAALAAFRDHEEVVLWFEHDLFDHLQLLQILDWFAGQDLGRTRLSIIQIGAFPGVDPFHGLGQLTGEQLLTLIPARKTVSTEQLALGSAAWKAFCAPQPGDIVSLLSAETRALPFLAAAIRRWLEEFPALQNGLSRTEHQLLKAAASGLHRRTAIYFDSQQHENPIFMSDASAWLRLDRLAGEPAAALERTAPDQYGITPLGLRLLVSDADWIRSRGGIDLWLGGVHLEGPDAVWRWDRSRGLLATQ